MDFFLRVLIVFDIFAKDVFVVARNDNLLDLFNALQDFLELEELVCCAILCEITCVDENVCVWKLVGLLDKELIVSVGSGEDCHHFRGVFLHGFIIIYKMRR